MHAVLRSWYGASVKLILILMYEAGLFIDCVHETIMAFPSAAAYLPRDMMLSVCTADEDSTMTRSRSLNACYTDRIPASTTMLFGLHRLYAIV